MAGSRSNCNRIGSEMGPQPISGAASHRKGTVKRLMRSAAMAVLFSSAPNRDAPITLPIPRVFVVSGRYGEECKHALGRRGMAQPVPKNFGFSPDRCLASSVRKVITPFPDRQPGECRRQLSRWPMATGMNTRALLYSRYSAQQESFAGSLRREMATILSASDIVG